MNRRAFSMVEVAISALVLALMMASALNAAGLSAKIRGTQATSNLAAALCSDMLSEVRARPMPATLGEIPTGTVSGARDGFDDVLDFANYIAFPPTDEKGTPIQGAENWWLRVTMQWLEPDNLNRTSVDPTGVLGIRVTVNRGSKQLMQMHTVRTAEGDAARFGGEP